MPALKYKDVPEVRRDPALDSILGGMSNLAASLESGDEDGAAAHLFQFFETFPIPAWIKRTSGKMLRINSAFESEFGLNNDEYVDDFGAWDEDGALEFRINDIRAVKEGRAIYAIEPSLHPQTDKPICHFVIKWPLEVQLEPPTGLAFWEQATGGISMFTAEGEIAEVLQTPPAHIMILPDGSWNLVAISNVGPV